MNTFQPFKRGDTFNLVCVYKQDDTPTSVENMTIRSQIRKSNKSLVSDLDATILDQEEHPGEFVLVPDTDTADWPLETLLCDIQISEGSTIRSTQTFMIPIIDDVTK